MQAAACGTLLFCASRFSAADEPRGGFTPAAGFHTASSGQSTPASAAASNPSPQAAPSPAIERASRIQPTPPGYKFPDGQTYVYEVEWRLWNAGTATLRVDPAGAEQHVRGTGDALGFVALLYKVHDTFDSYFDPQTFCSARIQKHTEEGSRRVENTNRFDYQRRKAVLQQTNLRKGDTKRVEHDIPDCVTDVISAIFYVQSLPLVAGAAYEFPLNDGGETVDVKVNVEAREEIKTPSGTFRTVRVQPEASKGPLKDRGHIWVWYTDDASHIPVQMRARMFWGTLTLRLARVEK
jgi:hypothetical protein